MDPLKTTGAAHSLGRSTYGAARGILGGFENAFLILGAAATLGFCGYITLGIILRSFFSAQIPDEVVIVGELMVASLVLPLGFVAADRGFIAVEVFTNRFSARAQLWLDVLAAAVGLVATVPITYAAYLAATHAMTSGNYFFGNLSLPEWPGRMAFFAGYAIFMLRLVDLFVHDLLMGLGILKSDGPDRHHQDHEKDQY